MIATPRLLMLATEIEHVHALLAEALQGLQAQSAAQATATTPKAWQDVLAAKQPWLDRVAALRPVDLFARTRQLEGPLRAGGHDALLGRLREAMRENAVRFAAIAASEHAAEQAMQAQLQERGAELRRRVTGRIVRKRYQASSPPVTSRFLNRCL